MPSINKAQNPGDGCSAFLSKVIENSQPCKTDCYDKYQTEAPVPPRQQPTDLIASPSVTLTRRLEQRRRRVGSPHRRDPVQPIHGCNRRTLVEKVHQDKRRSFAVQPFTLGRGIPEVAGRPGWSVGDGDVGDVRDHQAKGLSHPFKMVHQREPSRSHGGRYVPLDRRRTIRGTGEPGQLGHLKRILEHVIELIEQIWGHALGRGVER